MKIRVAESLRCPSSLLGSHAACLAYEFPSPRTPETARTLQELNCRKQALKSIHRPSRELIHFAALGLNYCPYLYPFPEFHLRRVLGRSVKSWSAFIVSLYCLYQLNGRPEFSAGEADTGTQSSVSKLSRFLPGLLFSFCYVLDHSLSLDLLEYYKCCAFICSYFVLKPSYLWTTRIKIIRISQFIQIDLVL